MLCQIPEQNTITEVIELVLYEDSGFGIILLVSCTTKIADSHEVSYKKVSRKG